MASVAIQIQIAAVARTRIGIQLHLGDKAGLVEIPKHVALADYDLTGSDLLGFRCRQRPENDGKVFKLIRQFDQILKLLRIGDTFKIGIF